jgi:hypothetical protein
MNVVEQEVWAELRRAAIEESEREPVLSGHLYDLVIRHPGYPEALAYLIAASLGNHVFNVVAMSDLTSDTIRRNPEIVTSSLYDLNAVLARDPACEAALVPFLYYKGFKGLQGYRVAHALWTVGRFGVARFLQSRIAEVFAMDIHPAARIGRGVFIDHGPHRHRRNQRSRDASIQIAMPAEPAKWRPPSRSGAVPHQSAPDPRQFEVGKPAAAAVAGAVPPHDRREPAGRGCLLAGCRYWRTERLNGVHAPDQRARPASRNQARTTPPPT